jgi:hypothetical protein
MSRFIFRYQGSGPKPEGDVRRVAEDPRTQIVDESSRALLVEGESDPVRELADCMPSWHVTPEETYSIPDPRPHVARPPGRRTRATRRTDAS